jgi:hypothetical protein
MGRYKAYFKQGITELGCMALRVCQPIRAPALTVRSRRTDQGVCKYEADPGNHRGAS